MQILHHTQKVVRLIRIQSTRSTSMPSSSNSGPITLWHATATEVHIGYTHWLFTNLLFWFQVFLVCVHFFFLAFLYHYGISWYYRTVTFSFFTRCLFSAEQILCHTSTHLDIHCNWQHFTLSSWLLTMWRNFVHTTDFPFFCPDLVLTWVAPSLYWRKPALCQHPDVMAHWPTCPSPAAHIIQAKSAAQSQASQLLV